METTDILQVVGISLATALGVVALYFTYRQYHLVQRKKLVWGEAVTPLYLDWHLQSEIKSQLSVFFKEQLIEDASLIDVRLENKGRRDIMPADFVEPLKLSFGSQANILELMRVKKSSPELEVRLLSPTEDTNRLEIDKLFLQKEEWFQLVMIVTGYERTSLSARIAECDVTHTKRLASGGREFMAFSPGALRMAGTMALWLMAFGSTLSVLLLSLGASTEIVGWAIFGAAICGTLIIRRMM